MNEMRNLYVLTFNNLVSNEGKVVFFKNVAESFAIENSPFAQNFGEDFKKLIDSSNVDTNGDNMTIFSNSNFSLERIYAERSRTTKLLLISSVALIFTFIFIVLFLILKSTFYNISDVNPINLINIILTAVPVLLGGGLFVLYSKENDKLDKVEQDIRYFNKMVGILTILNTIQDDAMKKDILETFLKTIKI